MDADWSRLKRDWPRTQHKEKSMKLKASTKEKLGIIAKGIGLGLVDSIPVVGTSLKANIQSEISGEGGVDWVRLITSIAGVIGMAALFLLFAKGYLTYEQLENLLKAFT